MPRRRQSRRTPVSQCHARVGSASDGFSRREPDHLIAGDREDGQLAHEARRVVELREVLERRGLVRRLAGDLAGGFDIRLVGAAQQVGALGEGRDDDALGRRRRRLVEPLQVERDHLLARALAEAVGRREREARAAVVVRVGVQQRQTVPVEVCRALGQQRRADAAPLPVGVDPDHDVADARPPPRRSRAGGPDDRPAQTCGQVDAALDHVRDEADLLERLGVLGLDAVVDDEPLRERSRPPRPDRRRVRACAPR